MSIFLAMLMYFPIRGGTIRVARPSFPSPTFSEIMSGSHSNIQRQFFVSSCGLHKLLKWIKPVFGSGANANDQPCQGKLKKYY